ncbi:MAG TPA: hypothetical protein VLD38_00230 [Nitrosopumilaceae archaeon]|nr:hypothetical protein [Nitrosopumilaceae archaeon]
MQDWNEEIDGSVNPEEPKWLNLDVAGARRFFVGTTVIASAIKH